MDDTDIFLRDPIAPCGLDCSRCVGCVHGKISKNAQQIAETLGDNFDVYAERLKSFNPAMENYAQFRTLLDSLSAPSCNGCRSDNRTCLPDCRVADCVKEQQVEFCFECSSFPDCGKTGLQEPLFSRWKINNEIMRKRGIEKFIALQAERPRYP
ncbi:DUF3795 domain-containing protein [Maridesulfovibrio zosterae]|uniref:DUF3795 domain-containing protein n=1 Tax=Maridesulfovibrio zosterae TaxID=82171 RepID=UPI00041ACD33|nr:DUF3795 domain-containing protein [Maridesulfovibrio zosterae]